MAIGRPIEVWTYNYEVLARLTDQPADTVRQHRIRHKFDPNKLETVAVYLARFGTAEIRKAIVEYAINRDANASPLLEPRPKKRTAKKTTPKKS